MDSSKDKFTFEDFRQIMERLIAPNGCPWDRVQTHESLKRYLIEECYEAVEAINNKDSENLCEELGDVLLQVVFHSLLGEKEGAFSLEEVIDGVSRKMINRHRHIFGNAEADTPEEVLKSWEEIKKEEKGYKSKTQQLRSVPSSFPALLRADKVCGKVERLTGKALFEGDLYEELNKEVKALKGIEKNKNQDKMDKIGKILLIITNISRKNEINSEFALTNALETYINKFEYVESNGEAGGKNEDTHADRAGFNKKQ